MSCWPNKLLLETAEIVSARVEPFEGVRRYVATGGLDGSVLASSENVDFQSKPSRADLVAKQGDVLFARMQATNKVTLITKETEDCIWSTGFAVLRSKPDLSSQYLMYYLASPLFQTLKDSHCTGATQKSLPNDGLKKITIPLPPISQQNRIVKLLAAADDLRKLRGQANERTNELIPALFYEMFGDPVVNTRRWKREAFANLLDGIDGGWSPTCHDRIARADEWGVLKLGAVTTCSYSDTENKGLPENLVPRPELEVKVGDLLFARKNTYALVAACALVLETRPKLMLSDLIFRFRLKSDAQVNPYFLWGLLTVPAKRRQVQALASGSAGSMPNISKSRLLTLPIEVPPLPLQNEFAGRLIKVSNLEVTQSSSRQHLDNLFQSVLHRAFSGEL